MFDPPEPQQICETIEINDKFLANYCDLVHEMKLGVRYLQTDEIAQIVREYLTEADIEIGRAMQTSHGGSLFRLRDDASAEDQAHQPVTTRYPHPYPDNFFGMRTTCGNECSTCRYCANTLQAASAAQPA